MLAWFVVSFIATVGLFRSFSSLLPDPLRISYWSAPQGYHFVMALTLAVAMLRSYRVEVRPRFFVLAGLLWGILHSASLPSRQVFVAEIIERQHLPYAKSPALVLHEQRIFEIQTDGNVGQTGSLRRIPIAPSRFLTTYQFLFISEADSQRVLHLGRVLLAFFNDLRLETRNRLSWLPRSLANWFLCLILGDASELSRNTLGSFINLGLIHQIVVSGSHMAFISTLLRAGFLCIFGFIGVLKVFPKTLQGVVQGVFVVVNLGCCWSYGLLVGLSAPVQRSLLFMTLQTIQRWRSHPEVNIIDLFLKALVLQICFFPVGFVSESNFISWGVFSLLVYFDLQNRRAAERTMLSRLAALTRFQLATAIFVAPFCGSLSLGGILANALTVFIFPVVFWTAFIALLPLSPDGLVAEWLMTLHQWFLNAAEYLGGVVHRVPFLALRLPSFLRLTSAQTGFLSWLGLLVAFRRNQPSRRLWSDEKSKNLRKAHAGVRI